MSIPIEALSEPFPYDPIKQRKGNFGSMLDYIDAATVIQRLNEVLEGEWSFTVLSVNQDSDEIIVHTQMQIDDVVRHQFGGSKITRRSDTGEPDLAVEPVPNDIVQLALHVVNSYDGSTTFGLALNANRLVCTNGMMIDFFLGDFKFRHYGHDDFQQELEEASNAVMGLAGQLSREPHSDEDSDQPSANTAFHFSLLLSILVTLL